MPVKPAKNAVTGVCYMASGRFAAFKDGTLIKGSVGSPDTAWAALNAAICPPPEPDDYGPEDEEYGWWRLDERDERDIEWF